MGEDPEQLEREIERTREKLGQDIDALENKVNPKKVAHRSVDKAKVKAKDTAVEFKEKVTGAATAAKEKVADAKTKVTEKVSSDSPAIPGEGGSTDSGGGLGAKVSGLVGTAREKAAPLASTARDRAVPLATTAKEKAAERVGMDPRTADTREVAVALAGGSWSTLLEQTRRNPVLAGAVTFVLGLVIGHR